MQTEHGGEACDTVDVVVEVDLAVLVTVALHERVERRVAHLHSCTPTQHSASSFISSSNTNVNTTVYWSIPATERVQGHSLTFRISRYFCDPLVSEHISKAQ